MREPEVHWDGEEQILTVDGVEFRSMDDDGCVDLPIPPLRALLAASLPIGVQVRANRRVANSSDLQPEDGVSLLRTEHGACLVVEDAIVVTEDDVVDSNAREAQFAELVSVAMQALRAAHQAGVISDVGEPQIFAESAHLRFSVPVGALDRPIYDLLHASSLRSLDDVLAKFGAPDRVDPAATAVAERADRVARAMERHGMQRPTERIEGELRTVFKTCDWPPPPWADPDGFHEVVVDHTSGPGTCEADGTNDADRITSNCPVLELTYDFGSQGGYEHLPPITARWGSVITARGGSYDGRLPFYPDRREIVVLRNGKHVLADVRCIGEPGAEQPPRLRGFVEQAHGNGELGDELVRAVTAGESVDGRDFSRARVGGRNLEGGCFVGAILQQADFTGAHLTDADFSGADLRRARLLYCTLEGARLDGAKLDGAEMDLTTYQHSRWAPQEFAQLHAAHHLQIVGLDRFPPEVQDLVLSRGAREQGLVLTFDGRLHPAAPALLAKLIQTVLGHETDVGIEQQSRPNATPGFIRINGPDPADLILIAEAFYARLWEIAGASPRTEAVASQRRPGRLIRRVRLRSWVAATHQRPR